MRARSGLAGFFITALTVVAAVVPRPCGAATVTPIEIVVAQDGSGQFRTVQEAVMSVPAGSPEHPVIIRIKPGTYKELIYVQHEKRYFRFIGENAETTILTQELHANLIGLDNKPIGTFRTPSTVIDADDFIAENITFENAAGPKGQALAIRVDGDRAIFRKCRFMGWQDTLFINRGRHYFVDCYITGHVDFIFGGATAFFEHCHIHARGTGYLTASSAHFDQPYGFVFSKCRITGEPGVMTYLGRPWRDYSAVVFVNTEMDAVVRPEGWENWDRPEREKTARYSEFGSRGEGGRTGGRVAWARPMTSKAAAEMTPAHVLGGTDGWNPRPVR